MLGMLRLDVVQVSILRLVLDRKMALRYSLKMPKPLYLALSFALFGLTQTPALAAKLVDENICILENMGNTRSGVARLHISNACNFLSLHEASLLLNKEQRALSECVLKFMSGVESDLNATEIARSCQQLAWDGKAIP